MAEDYGPFDAGIGAERGEDFWSAMTRNWHDDGVVGDPSGIALKVYADSSGMQVFVRSGSAQIQGEHYSNSTTKPLAIAANASGNPRIDRVVLRLDPAANSINALILAGTPAASPLPPALTRTPGGVFEMSLAQVRVDAAVTTIAALKVTDERIYGGMRTIPCTPTSWPTAPRPGQPVMEYAGGVATPGWWDGAQKRYLAERDLGTAVASVTPARFNGRIAYWQRSSQVTLDVQLGRIQAQTTAVAEYLLTTLPTPLRPPTAVAFLLWGHDQTIRRAFVRPDGKVVITNFTMDAADTMAGSVSYAVLP